MKVHQCGLEVDAFSSDHLELDADGAQSREMWLRRARASKDQHVAEQTGLAKPVEARQQPPAIDDDQQGLLDR